MVSIYIRSSIYFMSWFRSRRFEVDQQCRVFIHPLRSRLLCRYIPWKYIFNNPCRRKSLPHHIADLVVTNNIGAQSLFLSLSLSLSYRYCFLSSSPNETAGYMTSLHSYVNMRNSDGFDRTCEHFHWTIIYRTCFALLSSSFHSILSLNFFFPIFFIY